MASNSAFFDGDEPHDYERLSCMIEEALGSTSNDDDSSGEDNPHKEQVIDYSDLQRLQASRHQHVGRKNGGTGTIPPWRALV